MLRKLTFLAALAAMALFVSSTAYAQSNGAGECSGGACGTPDQSGGGGCGCGGGSILINNTDEGDTYQYADDYDEDGYEDDTDNCPFIANKSQLDTDGDGFGDACDVCPSVSDKSQLDTDGDGMGDACDTDIDNDGILNASDNCPTVSNNFSGVQTDTDKDGKGDACDDDDDNDGWNDSVDNCPLVANKDQLNTDPDTYGNACDNDDDNDNIDNAKDNCPLVANPDQRDTDNDKIGDLCDQDRDNDGIPNAKDNCPDIVNKSQVDNDRDGKGDSCDNRYCFVVNGDTANCLDPNLTFHVFSPTTRVNTGEPTRLRLFANRQNAAIQYSWIVVKRPAGSDATVSNPQGTVRVSTPYEYHYLSNKVATFEADEPGEYQIKVVASLVFADTVNATFPRSNEYTVTVTADGDSMGGCSVGGGASGLGLTTLLLGLALLIRRRR